MLQNRPYHCRLARTLEGFLTSDHLVGDRAKGEDVAARVSVPCFELLRRHVVQRADQGAHRRQGRRYRRDGRHHLCDPEIEQLHARLCQHHVAGLQVSMDDPCPMRPIERVGDLNRHRERLRERHWASLESRFERLAFEILHDEVRRAPLFANVIQRADVRVVELRDGTGFAVEPFAKFPIGGERDGQHFDRNDAIEPRVARFVDLAHATAPEQRLDFVGAQRGAGGKCHGKWPGL